MNKVLPLRILLLCMSAFVQPITFHAIASPTSTSTNLLYETYQVAIRPYFCSTVQNCVLFNADRGSGGEGSTDWLDVQSGSAMFLIFSYSGSTSLECYGATAIYNATSWLASTAYTAKCTGASPIDGTGYTLYQTANYYRSGVGYRARYYITGGSMQVQASNATLRWLGIPGY